MGGLPHNRHLFRLAGHLESGLFQSYSGWAIRSIDQLCSETPTPAVRESREQASLQLLRSLYVGVGLAGLDRRIQAWSKDHWRGRRCCPHGIIQAEAGFNHVSDSIPVDVLSSISPVGITLRHLSNRSLLTVEGEEMQHCVGTMSSAIRAAAFIFLSVSEVSSGCRATMVLALDADGRWSIEAFRGFRNADLTASYLERNAFHVLKNLNNLCNEFPLLRRYRNENRLANSRRSCPRCKADSKNRLGEWLPGIGACDPESVLTIIWKNKTTSNFK